MAVRVPEGVIAEVRERTDIVRAVEQYVTLKRSGANFTGLCPFHEERSPSFVVSPQRRTFYCFGCQERGDVFDFLRKMEGKTFPEVLEDLAQQAGVDLPRVKVSPQQLADRQRRRDEREQSLKVNELACAFYQKELKGSRGERARAYLRSRGIGEEVADQFRLGCAPPSWEGLTRYLAGKQVPAYLAVRLGLVQPSRGRQGGGGPPKEGGRPAPPKDAAGGTVAGSTHHDFFRDRLMFPVLGPGGEVLAFSGRLLDPEVEERKYVNSPESPVYRKAQALYGLHSARRAMRRGSQAVLVEGNLDVLALHQAGFDSTVAPLGTALTPSQVSLLRRFVGKVVVLFDGDEAGRVAAAKAARLLLESDLEGWVADLPDGEDPDSLVGTHGADALTKVLSEALPGADHLIQSAAGRAGPQIPDRVRALEELAPVLTSIPNPVTRALYMEQAASALDMDRQMVEEAMERGGSGTGRAGRADRADRREAAAGRAGGSGPSAEGTRAAPDDPQVRHAVALLAVLAAHPHLAPVAASRDAVSCINDDGLRKAVLAALDLQASTGRVDAWELLNRVEPAVADLVAEAVLSERYGADIDSHRALNDIIIGLRLAQLNLQLTDLARQVKRAEKEGNESLLRELALKRHELSCARSNLIGERA